MLFVIEYIGIVIYDGTHTVPTLITSYNTAIMPNHIKYYTK